MTQVFSLPHLRRHDRLGDRAGDAAVHAEPVGWRGAFLGAAGARRRRGAHPACCRASSGGAAARGQAAHAEAAKRAGRRLAAAAVGADPAQSPVLSCCSRWSAAASTSFWWWGSARCTARRLSVANTALTGLLAMSADGRAGRRRAGGPHRASQSSWPARLLVTGGVSALRRPWPIRARSLLVLVVSLSGFASGMAMPSRDMIVRAVTPARLVRQGVRLRHHGVPYRRHRRRRSSSASSSITAIRAWCSSTSPPARWSRSRRSRSDVGPASAVLNARPRGLGRVLWPPDNALRMIATSIGYADGWQTALDRPRTWRAILAATVRALAAAPHFARRRLLRRQDHRLHRRQRCRRRLRHLRARRARHLGRFIPGNPAIVTQEHAGRRQRPRRGVSLTVAPKDGTVIGAVFPARSWARCSTTERQPLYDPTKLQYLASADNATRVCMTPRSTPRSRRSRTRSGRRPSWARARPAARPATTSTCSSKAAGAKFDAGRGLQGHRRDLARHGARRGRRHVRPRLVELEVAAAGLGARQEGQHSAPDQRSSRKPS